MATSAAASAGTPPPSGHTYVDHRSSPGESRFTAGSSSVDVEKQAAGDEAHLLNTTVRSISWRGVTVTVKDRETGLPKNIVEDMEGIVEAGMCYLFTEWMDGWTVMTSPEPVLVTCIPPLPSSQSPFSSVHHPPINSLTHSHHHHIHTQARYAHF